MMRSRLHGSGSAASAACLAAVALAVLAALSLAPAPAAAEQPNPDDPNECTGTGGEGTACTANGGVSGCDRNAFATVCVETEGSSPRAGTCRIPCGTGESPEPGACALGETCVRGKQFTSGPASYCKAARFRMDLNLLDQCVVHFLEGTAPTFSDNVCSLERNLSALLDQNGDRRFDVYDLDLCVVAFLEQPACTAPGRCSADDLTYCAADSDCGRGLHCDTSRHTCQRDCGVVAGREDDLGVVERTCSGHLRTCNHERGRCEAITPAQLDTLTCDVDGECPSGAYCFLGRCAPRCYRALECPGDDWLCTPNNRCRARPSAGATDGGGFDPRNFAIRFARQQLTLNAVENVDSSPLVIVDLTTKRQVLGRGAVSFGYRMEAAYDLKQDVACLKPFVDCADAGARPAGESKAACEARQSDCFVSADEEWLRLGAPFGTVNAAAEPTVSVELEDAVAATLTPGVYTATLRMIFDNGDSDSVKVKFTKASPSGTYDGTLTVYLGAPETSLTGSRPARFAMQMQVTDTLTDWHSLLAANNLDAEETLRDTTRGFVVHATMDGNSTAAFTRGDARSRGADVIPFIGLYSPDLRRLRLIGVIDIAADFCVSEHGRCNPADAAEMRVTNPFGRAIRRQLEFVGPFESGIARFHGLYRERIVGLKPNGDLTLEGGFIMDQKVSDGSAVDVPAPLVEAGSAPRFPGNDEIVSQLEAEIRSSCGGALPAVPSDPRAVVKAIVADGRKLDTKESVRQLFAGPETYRIYADLGLTRGDTGTDVPLGRRTVFPGVVHFSAEISQALNALASTQERTARNLSVHDFLSSRLRFCGNIDPDGSATPNPACVDRDAVRCGLALHRLAIVKGWVSLDQVQPAAEADPDDADALCTGDLVADDAGRCACPVPEMTLQEPDRCLCDEGCTCPEGTLRDSSSHRCVPELVGSHDLFCVDTFPSSGCVARGSTNRALFTLQEHNRFWKYFGEIERFEAGRDRSDAFMVLFRNQVNPFAQGAALAYKSDRLKTALGHYDALVQSFASPASAAVLFRWPARAFKQNGGDWLGIIEAALLERMDTIADAVDLKRRAFQNTGSADFTFAQHLVQYEYLSQAYAMSLLETWQRELFGWGGESSRALEKAQMVVDQLNPAKNAAGLTPNRVFFENSSLDRANWQNYLTQLFGDDGSSGVIGEAREQVDAAVGELQGALVDLDTLEASLRESREGLRETLNDVCGDPTPGTGSGDYCQQLISSFRTYDAWTTARDCRLKGGTAASCGSWSTFTCADYSNRVDEGKQNSCREVVQTFELATDDINGGTGVGSLAGPPVCQLKTAEQTIQIDGKSRPCVGGEVGALLQEKALVDVQRRQVVDSVVSLARRVQTVVRTADLVEDRSIETEAQRGALIAIAVVLDGAITALEDSTTTLETAADAGDCMFVFGFSNGTSCIGKGISTIIKTIALSVGAVIRGVLTSVKGGLEQISERLERNGERAIALLEADGEALGMVREVDALVAEYETLTQESFNLTTQIEHQRFLAQEAADRYARDVSFIADHLVGRESGSLLFGNDLVRAASESFRNAVKIAHKAAVAFIHHYNVPPADAAPILDRISGSLTIDEVADAVADLQRRAQDYCGREGLDCDASSNVETLRVSLRELLFPTLRNIAGGPTAGEQFHNSITRPPFVRRRVRGTETVDQIELPFSLPLDLKGSAPGRTPVWLIDPLSCNHLLDATSPATNPAQPRGTVAVNVLGRNLDGGTRTLRYELIRGASDFVRACTAEPVVREPGTLPVLEYPVRTRVVGYAPASTLSSLDSPPSFATRSQPFTACVNAQEAGGAPVNAPCWRFFARDRSLSSADWKVVLPLRVGDGDTQNAWVLGDGLGEQDRPLIEDIVLYFHYRSRPIQEF